MRTLEGSWATQVSSLNFGEFGYSAFLGYRRVRRIRSYELMRQILNLGHIIEESHPNCTPMLFRSREDQIGYVHERIARNWHDWRHCIIHTPREHNTIWYIVEEV